MDKEPAGSLCSEPSDSDKPMPGKCREVSLDGCRKIGSGQKGTVYRYGNELILKVYDIINTYRDVEREIALSRRAFVLGIPTAISFGIVSLGDRYGAVYELLGSENLSACIANNPSGLDYYAGVMAKLARTIHSTEAKEKDCFPDARDRFRAYITNGLARCDRELADRCCELIDGMQATRFLIHGDFHTSNVFLHKTEALAIDMDRLSTGDPIFELGDMNYYFDKGKGKDPEDTDPYLGISYRICREFLNLFMRHYLQTQDEARLREVTDRAALLGDLRRINRYWKAGALTEETQGKVDRLIVEMKKLLERVDSLDVIRQKQK